MNRARGWALALVVSAAFWTFPVLCWWLSQNHPTAAAWVAGGVGLVVAVFTGIGAGFILCDREARPALERERCRANFYQAIVGSGADQLETAARDFVAWDREIRGGRS